jgi:hypothetical protein
MSLNLELNEGQPPGGRYVPVARDEQQEDNSSDEQQPMIGGGSGQAAACDDGSGGTDTAGMPDTTKQEHYTYEIAGEALDSIGRVATEEWTNGRVVGAEELQASAAVVNDRLVRTMLSMWRPEYDVVGVRAFAGARRTVATTTLCAHRRA